MPDDKTESFSKRFPFVSVKTEFVFISIALSAESLSGGTSCAFPLAQKNRNKNRKPLFWIILNNLYTKVCAGKQQPSKQPFEKASFFHENTAMQFSDTFGTGTSLQKLYRQQRFPSFTAFLLPKASNGRARAETGFSPLGHIFRACIDNRFPNFQ